MLFNYIDSHPQSTGTTKQGAKKGSSATQRMLADRTAQLDAEDNSGELSVWRDVYAVMRCPGPPCDKGPYCFRDLFRKKHYSLRTHHLRALVNFVEQGNVLQSQGDVPEFIREQLVAKEHQRLER